MYDSWVYQLFNLFYTSIPIINYALFDEEFPSTKGYINLFNAKPNYLETHPKLYELGKDSKIFNHYNFWFWIFNGIWHAAVMNYFT